MGFKTYNDSVVKINFINDLYFDVLAVDFNNNIFTTYKRLAQFMVNDLGFAMHLYQEDIDDVYYNNLLKMFKSEAFITNINILINNVIKRKNANFVSVSWNELTTPNKKTKSLMSYLFNVIIKNSIMSHNRKITPTIKMISHTTSIVLMFNAEQI